MDSVKILQVVGFKNSGKTTILSQWIRLSKNAGKRVATIKHHGHGGSLDLPSMETDGMKFIDSGALSSIVVSDDLLQMHLQKTEIKLDELIELIGFFDVDIILIEGFKEAAYEKVVMIRTADDWRKLKNLSNISYVISHKDLTISDYESTQRSNQTTIDSWYTSWMEHS